MLKNTLKIIFSFLTIIAMYSSLNIFAQESNTVSNITLDVNLNEGTAPCIFINYNEDDVEFKISMIRSNSYRHLTDKEKENLIDITLEYVHCLESNGKREKGRTREIISEMTGISVYFIQNYLSNKNKEKNYGLNQTEESTEQEIGTKLKKFVKKLDKLSEEALKIEFEEVSFEEHELLKDAIEDLKNSLDKIIY